jgi:2-methylcitrate dehydratase PrpD
MELDRTILSFVHDTCFADLPDEIAAFGRRCVLDLFGVAAAGSTTPLATIIAGHAVEQFAAGPRGSAPILFDGRRVSPAGAALAGAMMIDSIDAHDGHRLTKGHAGCGLLPAALAFAAAEGIDDAGEILTALVVGYEVALRAGIVLHETADDYHTSGAWVAVATAAMGSRLLGLDEQATAHALGIAEYHGPRSQMMRVIDHPTMLKDGSGWGAMAGVSATYLARSGFTGAPAITVAAPDVAEWWADLGSLWRITEQYFKPHPVCRWAQPAVEAALGLRSAHRIDPAAVARIEVTTFHEAARLVTRHPADTEQAQYSLPFPLGAAVVRGALGTAEISADALHDPEIAAMADLVVIAEDDDHNRRFPGERLARVAIELDDGSRHESTDTYASGDPHTALSDAQIRAKFHGLADPVLGVERADTLEAAVDAIGPGVSLSDLAHLTSGN